MCISILCTHICSVQHAAVVRLSIFSLASIPRETKFPLCVHTMRITMYPHNCVILLVGTWVCEYFSVARINCCLISQSVFAGRYDGEKINRDFRSIEQTNKMNDFYQIFSFRKANWFIFNSNDLWVSRPQKIILCTNYFSDYTISLSRGKKWFSSLGIVRRNEMTSVKKRSIAIVAKCTKTSAGK